MIFEWNIKSTVERDTRHVSKTRCLCEFPIWNIQTIFIYYSFYSVESDCFLF